MLQSRTQSLHLSAYNSLSYAAVQQQRDYTMFSLISLIYAYRAGRPSFLSDDRRFVGE